MDQLIVLNVLMFVANVIFFIIKLFILKLD